MKAGFQNTRDAASPDGPSCASSAVPHPYPRFSPPYVPVQLYAGALAGALYTGAGRSAAFAPAAATHATSAVLARRSFFMGLFRSGCGDACRVLVLSGKPCNRRFPQLRITTSCLLRPLGHRWLSNTRGRIGNKSAALPNVRVTMLRLKRDDFSSNRHRALTSCWSMIFSENRYPLFGIMRWAACGRIEAYNDRPRGG